MMAHKCFDSDKSHSACRVLSRASHVASPSGKVSGTDTLRVANISATAPLTTDFFTSFK